MNKNNNNNNNNNSIIIILVGLLEHEIEKITTNNNKNNFIIAKELDSNIIIEKIKEYVKQIDSSQITIVLIANIVDDNEEILFHGGSSFAIEDLINSLRKNCYNRKDNSVTINKQIVFKNYFDKILPEKIKQRQPLVRTENKVIINGFEIKLLDMLKKEGVCF